MSDFKLIIDTAPKTLGEPNPQCAVTGCSNENNHIIRVSSSVRLEPMQGETLVCHEHIAIAANKLMRQMGFTVRISMEDS